MKITVRQKAKEMHNKGITLIALVITIIVLLILAGISIAMLTGENGILTKATQAAIQTDVAETKEQIQLEIMENADENGNYTNTHVIEAVKKVTEKEVAEKEETVESKKGNPVNISDLWIQEQLVTFTIKNGNEGQEGLAQFSVPKGTTWLQFMKNYRAYDWTSFTDWENNIGASIIEDLIGQYENHGEESIGHNSSSYKASITRKNNETDLSVKFEELILNNGQYQYTFQPGINFPY